ncbi:DNA-binding protein [Caldalkalibacillus thermarum]|uniref:helix-turn-helix domain-containing protein n=1 Tax=Caldalkalibacillus thermarum TaxID=296745 RepID=UPI001666D6D1|nr:XRE family transcriptional regulator [Caldalkalibacillus thermarum]GGK16723.1 DNA-binding protein [Caldalkalibacillus thermarum]GGK26360.1 DNA-binding protein [Caldalkalibacillus thermarum]
MSSNNPWEENNVGKRIGAKLRQIRRGRGLSMEALANQIGVSKMTLAKIEQGEANPTLSVIWKIANGLSIPITALLSVEANVSLARKNEGLILTSANDSFTVEPLFGAQGSFELYRGYLQAHSEYPSEAHAPGVVEFVTVMSGKLTVEVDGETYHLEEHDSIRFSGDRPHTYINPSPSLTVLNFVIAYTSPETNTSVLFRK